jgi:hypothetical protein
MEKFLDLINAWAHEYFKHPLPDIRVTKAIKPGKLYQHYGYIIKAVPLSKKEVNAIKYEKKKYGNTDKPSAKCQQCPLYKNLPCPLYNTLKNGKTVCDYNRYKIIKNAQD